MSILRLRPILARAQVIRHPQHACAFSYTRVFFQSPNVAAADPAVAEPRSSCPPNTVLEGIAYLKDQPPVLALPDEEYPPWLWDLLKPKVLPDDGPGGKAEKVRLRKERRQKIKDQNTMKVLM